MIEITDQLLKDLSTDQVKASRHPGDTTVITFTHSSYPFKAEVNISRTDQTMGMMLASGEAKKICEKQGLNVRGNLGEIIKITSHTPLGEKRKAPGKLNLLKNAGSKRLYSYYDEWFSYINEVRYRVIKECAQDMVDARELKEYHTRRLLDLTEASNCVENVAPDGSKSVTIKNSYMAIERPLDGGKQRVEVYVRDMTDEQVEMLFVFLDRMAAVPNP